jgi:hypothetical protein
LKKKLTEKNWTKKPIEKRKNNFGSIQFEIKRSEIDGIITEPKKQKRSRAYKEYVI